MDNKDHNTVIEIIPLKNGFHGGAWKVAYADFVTAMMAFFLLMWLLNATSEEQKSGISDYFTPSQSHVSKSNSGAGGVMGGLTLSPQAALTANRLDVNQRDAQMKKTGYEAAQSEVRSKDQNTKEEMGKLEKVGAQSKVSAIDKDSKKGKGEYAKAGEHKKKGKEEFEKAGKSAKLMSLEQAKKKLEQIEREKFKQVEKKIREQIAKDSGLKDLAKNILIDQTPEGLRIQIVDEEGTSMFASGSARMFSKTRGILEKMATIINSTTINELSIRGHTDSVPYGADADYTNWELSSDRANASRRVMLEQGIPANRLNNVIGKADTEHLMPEDPTNARNRRISVILLKEELTNPDYKRKVAEEAKVIEKRMTGQVSNYDDTSSDEDTTDDGEFSEEDLD